MVKLATMAVTFPLQPLPVMESSTPSNSSHTSIRPSLSDHLYRCIKPGNYSYLHLQSLFKYINFEAILQILFSLFLKMN